GSECLQQLDITRAFMAEGEFFADADAMDLSEVMRELADKRSGGLLAEFTSEFEQKKRVDPELLEVRELLRQRIDQARSPGGSQNGAGMFVEGDGEGNSVMTQGIRDGLFDDLLMPKMNAIEHPNGRTDLASAGPQIRGMSNQLHLFRGGKLEKGNDAAGEVRGRKFQEGSEGNGVGDGE